MEIALAKAEVFEPADAARPAKEKQSERYGRNAPEILKNAWEYPEKSAFRRSINARNVRIRAFCPAARPATAIRRTLPRNSFGARDTGNCGLSSIKIFRRILKKQGQKHLRFFVKIM